ncbi:hypothetical protein BX616_004815 [Lobosporangium transversale]|uniref:Elongation factor P n=1 Tax=Lobosporangium transversale TaxID=64571 RepID=A0A1Y2GE34_9FUNG|nr:hypothetical protein BCR41DRAFT_360734 [Lobosporangium transversale]KAF9918863.1 hypothetical protein BX616_004815 [Lobosporangium transversale]ORZ06809.1 hypothetical protein BCR41DRAFT_360734 [Lobosporangium transversale]|eukprot:XP_021877730.1 hypothetical protein BCR41DRAFT_360734 [Lobosporangium transversale]
MLRSRIFRAALGLCHSRQTIALQRSALPVYRALAQDQKHGFKTNVLQVRKGYVVEMNNTLSIVLKRETSVMGRGTSTVKLELQDLLSGTKHTERFRSDDMVEVTELNDRKCQFLYRNDGQIHLMDPDTFEMYEVSESVMEEKQIPMLQQDMIVHLSLYQSGPDEPEQPISIKLPTQATFVVKEAYPSAAQTNKGTVYKNADLDNGIRVQVPDFVNIGDRVVVDTETGKYVRRA